MANATAPPACPDEALAFIEHSPFADESPPGGDVVLLLIGIAVLAFYILRLLRATAFQRNRSLRRCELLLRYFGDPPCRRRRSAQAGSREESEVLAAVARGVCARVEANVVIAMPVLSSIGAGCMVSICVNLLAGSRRWMSFGQTCVAVGACAVVIFASACPSRVPTGRPGAVYSFVMATMSALVFTTSLTTLAVFLTGAIAVFFRVSMSVTYHRMRLVVLWNLIYLVCSFCTWMRTFGDMSASVKSILATEICCTLAVLMLSHSAAHAAEADVSREVEASVLRSESSGLWNLLELICDVVVPLDEGLNVTDKASRFSALVTLQGGSMEGVRLQDFMPIQEDRDAFEKIAASGMQRGQDVDGALPHALHVKLRDSLGNLLRVELFCAPFSTLARRGYFVGIREWGDDTPMTTCTTSMGGPKSRRRHGLSPATRAAPEPRPTLVGRPGAAAPPEGGALCESSIASGDSEEPSVASSSASEGPGSTTWPGWRLGTDADDGSSSGSISMSSSGITGSVGSRSARHRRRLRRRSHALALGELKPTSDMGADLAIVRVMRMVSIPDLGTSPQNDRTPSCCPLHRRIAWFKQRLRFMTAFECAPRFQPWSTMQCLRCGVVSPEDPLGARAPRVVRCFACEEEVGAQPQPIPLRAASRATL